VENPQLLRIIGKEMRNIEINHHQGRIPPTLPGHLSLTSPRLLLVRTRVTKVGHFPTVRETKDTAVHPGHQTNPALLRHINPLLRMAIIKAVLIPPIERNITTETKINTRIDLHLIPGTKTPNPADLGHGKEGRVTALSVVRICAARVSVAPSVRISAPDSGATSAPPLFTIELLPTGSFRRSVPLCSPPSNSRK
jgi:hypothetical protein